MNKREELRLCVEQALVDEGIARPYRFTLANNAHQVVEFQHCGIAVKYQFPGTPSDRRAMHNARSSLRKRIRTAERLALSRDAAPRPVLDAGGVLPREPDDVGAGRAGAPKHPSKVLQSWRALYSSAS